MRQETSSFWATLYKDGLIQADRPGLDNSQLKLTDGKARPPKTLGGIFGK
jgi:hypothetical protein